MEFNRNQFFFLGVLILFLGIQVRMVESYTLSSQATKFLADRSSGAVASASDAAGGTAASVVPIGNKTIQPPEWLGWCLISIGAVLVLHSLAMPRPS
ncbi:hypothetical protein NG895_07685 [Aeoliella sp. ICT_H6.2]|uniref:Uncharacterized protein n=1 Tax=Aeoliella straminimaris TaxID=2954799 RepID=A0A9X2F7R2_9BACT|nr:hypothetical protein [Aeoliella straminimaris]MCO6043785.1 hypothetical protein [Aeoliella straminimaris]